MKQTAVILFLLTITLSCKDNKQLEKIEVQEPEYKLSSIISSQRVSYENSSFEYVRIENYSNAYDDYLYEMKIFVNGDSLKSYNDDGYKLAIHAYPYSSEKELLKQERFEYGFERFTTNLELQESPQGNKYYSSKFDTNLNKLQYLIIYFYKDQKKIHELRLTGVLLKDLSFNN